MIIKKPYAFLIKNFILIHGLLFGLLGYILLKSIDISSFFADYVTNHSFIRLENLTSMYINYTVFLCIILAAILVLIIGAILKLKNKNANSYIYIFISLIIVFVYYIYMFSIFKGLETESLDQQTVMLLRDIALMILVPQAIFLFVILGRTLGFNLKQFDFKKDLEELDIDSTDNEEVEVILGNNNYKYARFFRKSLRLTKYFFLENKLFVIGVASILALGVSLAVFMSINFYSVNYTERQEIMANSLYYKVNQTIITEKDMQNKSNTKNKLYVVVELEVQNKFNNEYSLTRDTFRLVVNDEMLMPTFSLSERFMDLGTPFNPTNILPGEDKKYIVIFEINKEDKKSDYIFKIKNYDSKKIAAIDTRYKDIIVRPINIDNATDEGTHQLTANLNFEDTILKNTKMNITSYEIGDRFKEEYTYCIKEKCNNGTYVVIPNVTGKGDISILKINSTLDFDQTLYMKNYIKDPADLFENYAYVTYTSQGYVRTYNLNKIDVKYNKDKVAYLEVPSSIKYASKIDLIINIRGKKYTIELLNMNKNLK